MAKAVGAEGTAIGVDLSFEMCVRARRRLARGERLGAGAVVQADAMHMPFADSRFDAGFVSFTLELFDTREIPAVLAECRRILRPGGRLALVALGKRRPAPLMQRAYEWGHERFPHVLDCRPIHVRASLTEAGFTVCEVRHLSLWGLPVDVAVGETPHVTGDSATSERSVQGCMVDRN
jgi:demethylmenaquinone methyltransferase/2-methoxy-6-polyprenyl-1,4-benzoquinol methylase